MTVIAARSGVLACDSAWSWGDGSALRLGALQTKITRTRHGVLIGGAGDCSDRDIMRSFESLRTPNDFPSLADLSDLVHPSSALEFLFYFPDRQIWTFCKPQDGAPELYQVKQDFCAVGSGSIIAMALMDQGFSAHRAVEVTCKWDMACRPPVHFEQLPAVKAKKRARR